MKELTIKFHDFTLFINVDQQFVVHVSWLGACERYSMEHYFNLVERARGKRKATHE